MPSLVRMTARIIVWCGAAVLLADAVDRWARRGPGPRAGDRVAVVVLGFPGHTAPGRAVQRWRVRMAARALDRHPTARVVLTGGVTFGAVSEAAEMLELARAAGIDANALLLEERSTTTWENVAFSRPLVGDADRVLLVSDGLHARRARRYWRRQFPDDAGRVLVDPAHRPFEAAWIKVASAGGALLRPALHRAIRRRHRHGPG